MVAESQELIYKRCRPCEGMGQPLNAEQAQEYLKDLPQWKLNANSRTICREYVMKNFMATIRLINSIAKIAEEENHHPDLHLTGYRRLKVELSTHAIGGLSENDFIEAAKINLLPAETKES